MKAFKSGILVLALLVSAGVSAKEVKGGGLDGGGAGIQLSSETEVREAIRWAIEGLRAESTEQKQGPSWLFWATGGPSIRLDDGDEIVATMCLQHPWLCKDPKAILNGQLPLYRKTWDFLKLSPVEIKGADEGACAAPDQKDAAASVTEYKIGAKLCFSVDILRKTPRDVLRAQVASVLAHEMTHLLGYGDEIAEGVQDSVYASFSVAANQELQRIRSSLMGEFFFAEKELESVANGVLGDNADLKVMGYLGSFQGRISVLLHVFPVGYMKEPNLSVKQEMWKEVQTALQAPWHRMYALQMNVLDGKAPIEVQMEQATLALKELLQAQKLVAEFLGTKI